MLNIKVLVLLLGYYERNRKIKLKKDIKKDRKNQVLSKDRKEVISIKEMRCISTSI